METNRAACPLRAPATIQAPYGRLIEQTALLIELTALAVGPFPLTLRGGGTPAPTQRGHGRVLEGGVQEMCPLLLANRGWKCELGATRGLVLHRTGEFQQGRGGMGGIYYLKQSFCSANMKVKYAGTDWNKRYIHLLFLGRFICSKFKGFSFVNNKYQSRSDEIKNHISGYLMDLRGQM